MLRHLDLFAGIGGMSLASEATGEIATVGFVEKNPYCMAVLHHHWPLAPIFGDIHGVTAATLHQDGIDDVDIISGGFPCQPVSTAGRRLGQQDDRWLWPEFARLIGELRPTWVVGENVPGLTTLGLDAVLDDLAALCYEVFPPLVYPASLFGAPHRRNRIFIVAHAEGIGGDQGKPQRQEFGGHSRSDGFGDFVGDTNTGPGSERNVAAQPIAPQRVGVEGERPLAPITGNPGLQAQPRLGRATDGISRWLAERRFPARPGEAQYAWEAPRIVAESREWRRAQLEAFGNAVVPHQVYPLFAAIVATESILRHTQTTSGGHEHD